ncbi:MAG: prenyltransferase [Acidimicrobiales bacterium]|nr:MAG: prenyltransferase [Acidimicrobiales bacterium]
MKPRDSRPRGRPGGGGLPEVHGVLSADDLRRTGEAIAACQLPSGMIPWFPGGHADPWNHVEAAMALNTVGLREEAERAFWWLHDAQRPDGSWHQYYLADRVEHDKLDSNTIAYVATGVWHHWLIHRDRGFLETMWPVVRKAIDFVLDLQTPRGEIIWARHADGTPWSFALLTGCSSIFHSLRCAIATAEEVGDERPDWELSAASLWRVIRYQTDEAFAPKRRWAMDWYYPVLTGVFRGEEGWERLRERWSTFVMQGRGVRCVADRPWVTAAETCECLMAAARVGEWRLAAEMFEWTQNFRADDGQYWTGIVYPEQVHFPGDEKSTYTAAAVILAADALSGATPASGLFVEESLPEVIEETAEDPL